MPNCSKESAAPACHAPAPRAKGTSKSRGAKGETMVRDAERRPATGTFLDTLPLTSAPVNEAGFATTRTALYGRTDARDCVLIPFQITLESFGLFRSISGCAPTRAISDRAVFAGAERHLILGRKLRGVLRRAISERLAPDACSDGCCGACSVCGLFGHLSSDGGNARLWVLDLWETAEAAPVTVGVRTITGASIGPRDEEMVPPGSTFVGLLRVLAPTVQDLALVLLGLEEAGVRGIGTNAKEMGKFTPEYLGVLAGDWRTIKSVRPILERVAARGISATEAIEALVAEDGHGAQAIVGGAAADALDLLARTHPAHPCYGAWNLKAE